MNKLIVLNHKTSLEHDEVFPYIQVLNKIETPYNLVVCPSYVYLVDFINHCTWGVGAQNVSCYDGGEYTGEVSALQLKSIGIEYSLIGHYERKKYFHETIAEVHQKLIACLESNIIPILCFGETGKKEDIIQSLDVLLKDIENIDFIVFAYEPLKVKDGQNSKDIQAEIDIIYDYLYQKYHSRPNIIYGGGITAKDISSILSIDKLNGILIGKISSDIKKIEKVIHNIKEVK